MIIKIEICDDNETPVARRTTGNWEIAEQNLASLKKYCQTEEFKHEMELIDLTEENADDLLDKLNLKHPTKKI